MSEGEARKLDSPLMIFSLDDEGARLKRVHSGPPMNARRLR